MRVIMFDLDCCRPDHLSSYGYHRKTSPAIDEVASEGVRFNRCYASNSPCLPARAAVFSGRFGVKNGVVTNRPEFPFRYPLGKLGRTAPMLPTHLARHGVTPVSFSPFAERHSAAWFAVSWTEAHDHVHKRGGERADEVNEHLIPWLKLHAADENLFLHVHYWDIHSPYRTPEERTHVFDNDPPPDWPDEETIRRQYESFYGPRTARDLYTGARDEDKSPYACMPDHVSNRDDFVKLINSYDATIRYTDDHIREVLDVVREAGVWDDTAVIITGDHGDSFGEQGHYMDHGLANDAVTRVPMIVKGPGLAKGTSQDGLIYTLDVTPTLCDLFGAPVPPEWDGEVLTPALGGEEFGGRPYLVIDHGIYTLQRSVRSADWMLVRTLHPGVYPYEEDVWLYDMRADPHQTTNLAAERPEVVREHEAMMNEWWYDNAVLHQPDPMAVAVESGPFQYYGPEQMVRRLRATGRERFVAGLLDRMRRYHGNRYEHLR
jgi:arylsulfatase A-like enzyme